LLQQHAGAVFDALLKASGPPPAINEIETEARQFALKSLTRLATAALNQDVAGAEATLKSRLPAVFGVLLEATRDYTIDSRGDIGSKVREEAMECLQQVLACCSAAGPNGGHVEPAVPAEVVRTLVQQSMEKIDRTRGIAGEILTELVHSDVANIPRQAELRELVGQRGELHWQAPRETFPRTVQLLAFDEYRRAALTGLVISVGGLTESLVKASSASLLEFLKASDPPQVQAFFATLLEVFKDNATNDRVTVPVLNAVDLLFCNGVLDPLIADSDTAAELLNLTRAELRKSANVKKIRAGVDVVCTMVLGPPEVRQKALASLMVYLCHKYPRVRRFTAEALYVALVMVEDTMDRPTVEAVQSILQETLWDDNVATARVQRNKICDLLGVAKPKTKAANAAAAAKKKEADDLDSYRDLVERAHGGGF